MPISDKWLKTVWYSHTMDYYLTLKRNEVLIHAINGRTSKPLRQVKGVSRKRPRIV